MFSFQMNFHYILNHALALKFCNFSEVLTKGGEPPHCPMLINEHERYRERDFT